jgi:hypothetical protein
MMVLRKEMTCVELFSAHSAHNVAKQLVYEYWLTFVTFLLGPIPAPVPCSCVK